VAAPLHNSRMPPNESIQRAENVLRESLLEQQEGVDDRTGKGFTLAFAVSRFSGFGSAREGTVMAVDRYTKMILTVIAVCLVWLSAGGPALTTPVSAQDVQRVFIAGWIDQKGNVRQLSSPPSSGATEGPLPVWVYNR
jgi:hypothetical protein